MIIDEMGEQSPIPALIDAAVALNQESPRPYLGVSQIGHTCERWLWLSFRWAVQEEFDGRMLRLFARGHREEPELRRLLEQIGVVFSQKAQERVHIAPHVYGHIDDIAESGVPEAEKTAHLVEYKTHSKKSFDALAKEGVKSSKLQHFVQMQLYMHGLKLTRALYVSVCKDDDRIYAERVRYDKACAEYYIDRAKRVVSAPRPPEGRRRHGPSWYECKYCPAYEICYQSEPTKEVNCRTCSFSTPTDDGKWLCERHDAPGIPVDFQRAGCDDHVLHEDLVPWEQMPTDHPHVAVYKIGDGEAANGRPGGKVFSSKELLRNPEACASGLVQAVREAFPESEVRG